MAKARTGLLRLLIDSVSFLLGCIPSGSIIFGVTDFPGEGRWLPETVVT
jgi:hypothetical protein